MPDYDYLESLTVKELRAEIKKHYPKSNMGLAAREVLDRKIASETLLVTKGVSSQTDKALFWARIAGIAAVVTIVVAIVIAAIE